MLDSNECIDFAQFAKCILDEFANLQNYKSRRVDLEAEALERLWERLSDDPNKERKYM